MAQIPSSPKAQQILSGAAMQGSQQMPASKSSTSTMQLIAIGLLVIGVILLGIAIMTW
jgi:hypothetical protein